MAMNLAMKPAAKKGLLVVGVLYALCVIMLIVVAQLGKTTDAERNSVAELQTALNQFVAQLNEKAEADPDALAPAVEIDQAGAREIWSNHLAPRAAIIAFNYTLPLQILNFLVLLLLLYGFLWDPLLKFLDERGKEVKENVEDAERRREEARKAEEEAAAERKKALEERTAAREAATREAQTIRDDVVKKAKEEAQRLVESTRRELEAAVDQAKVSLRAEVGSLACDVAAKMIRRELKPEDHEELVQEFVKDLEKADAGL